MYHHLLKKEENSFTNNGVVLNLENFHDQMDYLYNNKYWFKSTQFLITSYVKDDSVEFDVKTKQFLSWQDIIKTTDVF